MSVTIVHTVEGQGLAGRCWNELDKAGIVCHTVLDPFAASHLDLYGEGDDWVRACEIVARLVKEHNR